MIDAEGQRGEWERDERYLQLVELAPDAILIHDDGRIVLANASAVRLTRASRRADLIGLPISRLLEPPYLKSVEASLKDAHGPTDLAPPVEETLRCLDGSEIQVDVRSVGFVHRGLPAAHLVLRDLRGRHAANEVKQPTAAGVRCGERLESVALLAGELAHEVNTLMGVVLAMSEQRGGERRPADNQASERTHIVTASRRVADITDRLIAFSGQNALMPSIVPILPPAPVAHERA